MSPAAQNKKTGSDGLGTAENESGVQNMKTETDALGIAENENGRAKHEKRAFGLLPFGDCLTGSFVTRVHHANFSVRKIDLRGI
jgi:hypothetical protein